MLSRLRTRQQQARPFSADALAERTRNLFDFVERELGFELVKIERDERDDGFTLLYKRRDLGLGLAVGADARGRVGMNGARLDRAGRFRPFGRDALEAGDWWNLAHTVGAEPLERRDPERALARLAELLSRRRARLLESARKERADG